MEVGTVCREPFFSKSSTKKGGPTKKRVVAGDRWKRGKEKGHAHVLYFSQSSKYQLAR